VKPGSHGVSISARSLPGTRVFKESSIVLTVTLRWPTGDREGRDKALENVAQMMRGLLDDDEYAALIKHLGEEAPV
jgi:hypothetical protein